MRDSPVLIVGLGAMGRAYAEVLKKLEVPFVGVGRSELSRRQFEKQIRAPAIAGGIEAWLATRPDVPDRAIVATPVPTLAVTAVKLSHAGVRSLLVEKPGAMNTTELRKLPGELAPDTRVVVGYNRRFYASVQMAVPRIADDGGVTSFHFDFTEWGHTVDRAAVPPEVKRAWFFLNSTHVIDLAFFLGGRPRELKSFSAGALPWHPRARYGGAGVTQGGALFSYGADWDAPGRWGVEIATRRHRYFFRPLEVLRVQKHGDLLATEVPAPDRRDQEFKPGLFRQTAAFIDGNFEFLPSLSEQIESAAYYDQISATGDSR